MRICLVLAEILFLLPTPSFGQNYYQLLGVKPGASAAEIKRSFRSLAKRYHPDKSQESSDAEQFMKIRQAYEVIGNVKSRQQYDNKLKFQSATFGFGNGFFREKAKKTSDDQSEGDTFGSDFPFGDLFNMFMESMKTSTERRTNREPLRDDEEGSNTESALTRFIVKNILKALNLASQEASSGGTRRDKHADAGRNSKTTPSFTGNLMRAYDSCLGSQSGFPYLRCAKDLFQLLS